MRPTIFLDFCQRLFEGPFRELGVQKLGSELSCPIFIAAIARSIKEALIQPLEAIEHQVLAPDRLALYF